MDSKNIVYIFAGLLILFAVVVLFQQIQDIIKKHREEHPEEKIITVTNFLALIGALWLLWFINIYLMPMLYSR